MSDLLGLGAAGVRGYSRALQTIGDNIANAQTPGFARRTTVLAEQASNGQSILYRNQVSANGVLVNGVNRAVDPWLIQDARASASDAGRSGARLRGLEAAESAIADGGAGVGRAMTAFFNRADELAADPASATRRSAFLQSVDDTAAAFRRTADGLTSAAGSTAASAGVTVDQLNADTTALAKVNEGLLRARDGSTNQASLLDERDRLIDSISAALPTTVSYDASGAATLTLPGGTLVSATVSATVSVTTAADGRLSLGVTSPSGSFAVAPSSGTLSGQIDAADHIATQRSGLDTLAANFTSAVNAQHAAGRDANGNPGVALLTIGTGAASLAAVALTTADVAAADASSANGNALSFGNLRGPTGSEAAFAGFAAQQSQAVASARAQDSVASTKRDGAATARDDVSGVDLDREAADLVRYQQAYEASARVIQVSRELMQTILSAI
jgi:flagellar hook-associated protein 1 FlgK